MLASPDSLPLIAELLREQQRLQTPVARFAEAGPVPLALESGRPVHRDLLPLSRPGPGEQYAFEVDLDACSGCKSCVAACHALNGLDETESWRDVGLLVGGDDRAPFQQTVTTACHHCEDPGCLNGCPVLAYEKDPVTGIVRHLDDQCIGCQYCILQCPYDVPKYNERLGIVRKCDMCHGRLSAGEAPACAQACPTQAIRIVTVATNAGPVGLVWSGSAIAPGAHPAGGDRDNRTEVTPARGGFLPGAPDPKYTRATTRYVSRRSAPAGLHAADAVVVRPQPAHRPLAIMLTLLPLAVGCTVLAAGLSVGTVDATAGSATAGDHILLLGWLAGIAGLVVSVAHLGRPARAWRVFLGWRRSWLSREALTFGAWFAAVTGAVLSRSDWVRASGIFPGSTRGLVAAALTPLAAVIGLAGLGCSVMIYADTPRHAWRLSATGVRFFASAWVLGSAAAFALGGRPELAVVSLAVATLVKLAGEARLVRPANTDDDAPLTPALATARLLVGPLRPLFGLRVVAALAASVLLPAMVAAGPMSAGGRWVVLVVVFAGELLDRHLFFRAVDPAKMPGMPAGASRVRR